MIKIGYTASHGIMDEIIKNPAEGVVYSQANNIPSDILTGHLKRFNSQEHHLIEAFDFPCITDNNWIFQCYHFSAATSFTLFNEYFSRETRLDIISKIFLKDNFKRLIFGSEDAFNSLSDYGKIKDKNILDKSTVIYPAIRKISDELVNKKKKDELNILMIGKSFFRKGGNNLIDAFETLQKKYDNINLKMCSRVSSNDHELNKEYREKIENNKNIDIMELGREDVLKTISNSDIFVLPTFNDAFGFSIVEAMAFGLPIISTNERAIPEIVEDNKNGFLIDTKKMDFPRDDYTLARFPKKTNELVTEELIDKLSLLIEDSLLRKNMGLKSLNIARTKFSFEKRNKLIKSIYEESV